MRKTIQKFFRTERWNPKFKDPPRTQEKDPH